MLRRWRFDDPCMRMGTMTRPRLRQPSTRSLQAALERALPKRRIAEISCVPRTRTSYPHAKHAAARYSCEKKARMGRPYGSNWSGGNVRAELGDDKGHRWAMRPATNATSLESPHLTASAVAQDGPRVAAADRAPHRPCRPGWIIPSPGATRVDQFLLVERQSNHQAMLLGLLRRLPEG